MLLQDGMFDIGEDSNSDSDSDSEGVVKLISSPNVITVSCCENVADVTTQTETLVVSCRCDEVLQKLEEVLDGLNHLQDELCTQSCDLMDVRNRCLLIEKQVDHWVEHAHVSCLTIDVNCTYMYMCRMYSIFTCIWYFYSFSYYTVLYIWIIQHLPARTFIHLTCTANNSYQTLPFTCISTRLTHPQHSAAFRLCK